MPNSNLSYLRINSRSQLIHFHTKATAGVALDIATEAKKVSEIHYKNQNTDEPQPEKTANIESYQE